mgnify:CR=1 FL=1
MSYVLVKAPPREGDIPPEVLFRQTETYANLTPEEKAEYEEYIRVKNERKERLAADERRMMGTPDLSPDQPESPRVGPTEGTDVAQRAKRAEERELVSRPYINPDTGETEEDEVMQLTSGAQSEYDKMLAEALEAAQVDTTGTRAKRKHRTFEGGSWRDEDLDQLAEEREPSEWQQRTEEEKKVRFGRGAATGGTQGERKLGTRAAQLGPTGQQKESGFVAADRAGGPQAVREGKSGREFAPVYKPRASTTNILFEGEKRWNQKARRAEAARRRTHEQRQTDVNIAAFDAPAARDTDEAYVERNLPPGTHPLDIPHTPMQDEMLGEGRHVSPLRRVLQRYLISNPDELSEFLSMPHLAQYERQLEDPKNMNEKGYPNERGWHLINALTEQVMQEMGGGEHKALLDNLGLRMSPGHERNLPPHRSTRAEQKILNPNYLREGGWATDAEIDAQMDQFDKVGANPLAGMEADHEGWARQGEAAGVPDPIRFADQIESLVESGAEPHQALDTPEVSPFEHVEGTEKPEDYAVTGDYTGETTGRFGTPVGQKFKDTAPESDWGSDEARRRVRRIAREKRTEAIQEINDRRAAAGQPPIPISTRGPDMAPDISAGIEMDEETRRLLAQMGMNVPEPRDETVGELQARQNIQPRQTGPVRNLPQVNPDEDDEVSTMAVSGFSLGSQLLKAILDDMLK